jgi:hypothetical protein
MHASVGACQPPTQPSLVKAGLLQTDATCSFWCCGFYLQELPEIVKFLLQASFSVHQSSCVLDQFL